MHRIRKLSLKRERMTELSAGQLDGLAGGLAAEVALTGTGAGLPSDNRDCATIDVHCGLSDYRTFCPTTTTETLATA